MFDPSERRNLLQELTHPDAPWTLVIVSNERDVRDLCQRHVRLEGGALLEEPGA